MESDDDYQISSHPEEPSSPIHQTKLKRLKKAVSNGLVSKSVDQGQSTNVSGSSHDVDQESTKALGIGNSVDSVQAVLGSEGFDGERDFSSKQDEFPVDRGSLEDEELLNVEEKDSFDDFDAATEEFELKGDGLIDILRAEFGHSKTEKQKEKRRSSEGEEPHDADMESSKTLNIENLVDCEGDLTTKEDGFDSLWNERNVEEEDSFGDLDEAAEEFDVNKGGLINELRSEFGISKKKKRSKTEKKTHISEVGGEDEHKKSRKKRGKREGTDERPEAPALSKRRFEKERKIHLEQLHVESQRLLRETSGVAFKPVPLVKKPISSVLEKIRQRKLEVLKMASSLHSYDDSDDSSGDTMLEQPEHYPKNDKSDHEEGDDKHPKEVDTDVHTVNEEGSHSDAAPVHSLCDPASISHENILPNMAVDVEEVSKNAFLTQSDDTQQNILRGSQLSNEKSVQLEGQVDNPMDMQLEDLVDSPMEEAMAPSLLTMNLKLNPTSPCDVSSSDEEEDNETENIVPHSQIPVNRDLYSKGDPVKAFVDDEAEEEDDSDNDLMRFKEDEEDDENDASEEFNDLIVTGYKEKPIDNEKRDQLHQMWLEKQDAAATDNVLQRLKCGRKQKESPFLEEDEDDKEDEESGDDSADETLDHLHPGADQKNLARINSKKAKEMLPKMFTDKDDTFLSSDDEETEKKLARQRFAEKAEEHGSFLSPPDDESSREFFGLIKKLNVAPDTRKKAKPPSILDMLISGGNSNSSSKFSFLGRATSSSSLPTSRKHGSSTSRSYIFGRDDSNSRSEVSTSEVSIDMVVEKDSRTIATATATTTTTTTTTRTSSASAKFISSSSSSSQSSKCSTQNNSSKSSSLLEILRRSAEKSNKKNNNYDTPEKNNMESVAQFFSAFKPGGTGKKSSVIKIERRST